jgi:hypothetical protein
MKSLMHALHAVLVLSLLTASPVSQADPRHSSTSSSKSFKGGFSSQRSSSPPPRAPKQDGAARGGFGSFGSASPQNGRKSDSALSQRLDRNASEANALRTLDARRAAKEEAARDTRPVPGYENRQAGGQYNNQYGNQSNQPPAAPMPAQRSDGGGMGGLGGLATGVILGQMANGAHARNNNNGYPGPVAGNGSNVGTSSASVNQAPSGSFFGGVMRMFMWLVVLSAIGWFVYFLVQRKRRKTDANKPNYTFEGN